MATTNSIKSILNTTTELVVMDSNAKYLLVVNKGSSVIHIGFDVAATTNMIPISASNFWEPHPDYVQRKLQGVTLNAISASGTNALIYVLAD